MSDFLNINKFTKLEKIGKGAFGEVFKVKENGTENIYAAKISLSELDEDPSLINDLKSEVNILSQLNHPLILKFIGYNPFNFDHESYPVIISEYSPNGSLSDIIELDRKFTPPQNWTDTKKLINVYGIASAMSYLHSHNIIHRDLKPANILEDDNLFPKIADFGLSKLINMNSKSKEEFKGTPMYVAPEIWLDNEYSKAGDVYAFSMIVYELLTLDEPFKNYNYFKLYAKVIVGGERPEFRFPIPICYMNLITRCWSANPDDRPTFQEIVEELRKNKEFIIDTIDENEFYEFVELIDETNNSFDPNKKLKSIISKEDKEKDKDKEKSTTMSVASFNNLSFNSQRLIICDLIENDSEINDNEFICNIYELFLFLENLKPKREEKYIRIFVDDEEELIETICQQTTKIFISSSAIEIINDQTSTESNEFKEIINKFENINIEIKYPTTTFETNYTEILKFKEIYEEQILIHIFINDITNTDMRFRNDNNIYSITIGNDVHQISGSKEGSFCGCSSLSQISISSSVTEIGEYAFFKCSSLTQITIPTSVIKIGDYAFSECSSLSQITIPSSVTEIGDYAFAENPSLSQITIPSSVTEIGEYAFSGCVFLSHVSISSSIKVIKTCTFEECPLLRIISIPSSVIEIGDLAFTGCSSLTQIIIPSSVTRIGISAFLECSSLTQIIIPSSVIEIGKSAFTECSSLKQITIPPSVTEIAETTFDGCSSLTQITIPSSITKIKKYAFTRCSSITELIIPSSVTVIEEYAFSYCSLLTQFTIPSSLTEISESAFIGCTSLEYLSILYSITKIEKYPLLEYLSFIHPKDNNNVMNKNYKEEENKPNQKICESNFILKDSDKKINELDSNSALKNSEINKQQTNVEELIASGDARRLMIYLNNNGNEDDTSSVFDQCFLISKDFYLKICEEGILLNNAVAHHKYALLLILNANNLESEIEKRKNYNDAKNHLEKSIEQGFVLSYFSYARLLYEIFKRNKEAFISAEKGANLGEKYSKCLLGFFIAHGIGTEKDFNKGVSMMLNSNANDYYEIFATDFGIYYSNIKGGEEKTFYWFEKAFNLKHTKVTINNYGICFIKGIGVKKNIDKAKEIFQIGFEMNDINSMYHLGFILEEIDPDKSFEYYKLAADKGHVQSQKCLDNFILSDKSSINHKKKYH